jgi:hypothetical protein
MNELAVSIGVVLLPGLVTSIICDKTAAHSEKWDGLKYGIYSFVFGVLCYALIQSVLIVRWCILEWFGWADASNLFFPMMHVWSIAVALKPDIRLEEILFASIAAPFIAAAATWINNEKFFNRVFQFLGLSYKYGDENLFSHYLTRNDVQAVYVRDATVNHTYEGLVSSYSETDHIQELVLVYVTVYEYSTSKKLYDLPSIYLSKPAGTFVIEAIPSSQWSSKDAETSSCA